MTDTWALIGNMRGPKGDDGRDGIDGVDGVDGRDGEDGQAATIQVGDVATVDADQPATVTNVGDETDAIFDFEIPQGEQGETGPPGPPGPVLTRYAATILADEPVAYWRLNETGRPYADSSPNGLHLSIGTAAAIGRVRGALPNDPDGGLGPSTEITRAAGQTVIDDRLRIPAGPDDPGLTIECWMRQTAAAAASQPTIVRQTTTANSNWAFYGWANAGSWGVLVYASIAGAWTNLGWLGGTTQWNDQRWHHAVFTYDSTGGSRRYFDAALIATSAYQGALATDANAGCLVNGHRDRNLDEVAIYDYSLPPERIAAHYRAAEIET